MRSRTCVLLLGSALVLACVSVIGCGGEGDQPAQNAGAKLTPPRKLEPDIPAAPGPSPDAKGSLEPPAAPAAGTAAPAAGTAAPAAGTEAPAAGTEAPAAGTEAPAAETEAPAAETEAPAAEN
ncbi:MAG TPA: hypothetical protein VM431_01900 [Phycisphaerae bacterium]|nr:hypothetical protein [Phycisphaerae bacterium]